MQKESDLVSYTLVMFSAALNCDKHLLARLRARMHQEAKKHAELEEKRRMQKEENIEFVRMLEDQEEEQRRRFFVGEKID